jgi:hypothetical protein
MKRLFEPVILEKIRAPRWAQQVDDDCSEPGHSCCGKLLELMPLLIPHLSNPEIESAAVFVIFGTVDRLRTPGVMLRFDSFLEPVVDFITETQVSLIVNVINSCLQNGTPGDSVLRFIIVPFQSRLAALEKTTPALQTEPIFEAGAVLTYLHRNPRPEAYTDVRDFLFARMRVNEQLERDVSPRRQTKSTPKRRAHRN